MRVVTGKVRPTVIVFSCLCLACPSFGEQSAVAYLLKGSAAAVVGVGPNDDGTGPLTSPGRTATTLVIRTYDTFGMASDEMVQTRMVVAGIVAKASIQTLWRDCSTDGETLSVDMIACGTSLARNELMVRIVAAPRLTGNDTLGESMVECREKNGVLATVYADRIHALADRIGVRRGRLFGRAVAHEIGHLLLGTSRHAPAGLMRARWSDAEVQRDVDRDWMWSRQEIADIGSSVRARTLPAVTPASPATHRFDHGEVCR